MADDKRPSMTLPNGDTISEGGYGETRCGEIVGPLHYDSNATNEFVWCDPIGVSFTSRGRKFIGRESQCDIIAAWKGEPKPDTPKPLKDMTDAEIGALVRAHYEGKVIECFSGHLCGSSDRFCAWMTIDEDPQWWPDLAYRVRPEPKSQFSGKDQTND